MDLPRDEAVTLAGQVVGVQSRTYAAVHGWQIPLDTWLMMRVSVALSGSAEHLEPPIRLPDAPRPAAKDVLRAEAHLAARTAIQS